MKKILSVFAASAFALTLYAAPAAACPNMDKATVSKKKKDDAATNKKAAKKKAEKNKDKKTQKPTKRKVS